MQTMILIDYNWNRRYINALLRTYRITQLASFVSPDIKTKDGKTGWVKNPNKEIILGKQTDD